MARKKSKKRAADPFGMGALFDVLWKDPKYVALQARKDRLLHEWNIADAHKDRVPGGRARAARLDAIAKRVLRRLYAYEERTRRALEKAGAL